MDPKLETLIRSLATEGKTDAAIDRASGVSNWTVRRISYEARRDAGLIPNRVGRFATPEAVTAADVRTLVAEAPKLRDFALPIVYGFDPTPTNVATIAKKTSKVVARRYVGRGRPSNATLAARAK